MLGRELAHALEVTRQRRDYRRAGTDRFAYDRSQLATELGKCLFERREIVPGADNQAAGELPDHATRGRQRDGLGICARQRQVRLDREVNEIRPTVIVALEAQDFRAPCVAPCDAQREHHRLGSSIREPHLLPARHDFDRRLRRGDLQLVVESERRPHVV